MALQGTITTQYAPVQVTSIGVTNDTGWTNILTVPPSAFLSGTGNYAIVVFGNIGDPVWTGTPNLGTAEVGVTDDVTPGAFVKNTFGLNDGNLKNQYPTGPAVRSVPFFMQLLYTPAVGTWDGARSLIVRARMARNGDPPTWAGAIAVSELTVLIFDLGRLTASNYFTRTAAFSGAARENAINSEAWKVYDTSPTGFGANGEDWLCFASWNYIPQSFTAPPRFRVNVENAVPATSTIFGTHRFGMLPRGGAAKVGCHQYKQGGWFTKTIAPAACFVTMEGRDWHTETTNRTLVEAWQFFAVRLSAFSGVTKVHYGTANSVSDPGNYFALMETSLVNTSRQVILANQTLSMADAVSRSFFSQLRMEDGSHSKPEFLTTCPYVHNDLEGVQSYAAAQRDLGANVQHRFGARRNLYENPGSTFFQHGYDVSMVGFDFESSPNNASYPIQVSGADVVIAPGYEAGGLAALAELPIKPSFAMPVDLVVPHEELKPPTMPYRITWPRFLTPRGRYDIGWSGLTRAEVDTLSAFFVAQAKAAFKYQPPDRTSLTPFICVDGPQFDDVGRSRFNASIRAVELRYVGP